ncbi:MAG: hypothetical protein ABIA21_03965 [Candidatus Aenigmatarchaeota archaeon]
MGLFSRKPKETAPRPIPVDNVREMQQTGMAERDIIRQLKHDGYSFSEIEKAMLQAVKEGTGEEYRPSTQSYAPAPAYVPVPVQQVSAPAPRYQRPEPPQQYEQPYEYPQPEQPIPEQPPMEEPEPVAAQPFFDDDIAPETVMEDLIESVAREKFEKFTNQLAKIEGRFDEMKTELTYVREKAEAKPVLEIPKDLEDKIDDLEARIGGMERAFKQFLPSLTENIESLATMVHDMKEAKQKHSHSNREEMMA